MNLNTIFICILSIPILYLGYLYFTLPVSAIPEKPHFLWGEQVGRTRSIQSKTGDASMATELSRRRAIQTNGRLDKSKIKESRTSSGSTTGALEAFFLTSICPIVCAPIPLCPPPEQILDGGNAFSEYCPVLDGGDAYYYDYEYEYDGGDAYTIVCGV